ncbi:hypothetical protein GCM10023086_22360 [Streptomyces venetus]|uniref:NAD-dependent epimerase/dehydratase domain-containing protein n=1 Tax=Streptomyces venetus TaxID=1701086 RepID=A0ABP8FJC3_9ACTN
MILVIGGAGFIGSHIVTALTGAGHEVRVPGRAAGASRMSPVVPPGPMEGSRAPLSAASDRRGEVDLETAAARNVVHGRPALMGLHDPAHDGRGGAAAGRRSDSATEV